MREHGFSGAELREYSPAQLTWELRQVRRREARRDQRFLLVVAAGSRMGDAPHKLWRILERDARPEQREVAREETQIPRSQADFEQMMQED